MTQKEMQELTAREKQQVMTRAEETRPGPVFTPEVDILEKESEIVVMADMPGVEAEKLDIDLADNMLTLEGDVSPPEAKDEQDLLREYYTGKYYRQFTLSNAVDQAKIQASLQDGVLRLVLPKVEAAKPRKIAVTTG